MTRWLLCLALFACCSTHVARAAAPGLNWVRAQGAERCVDPATLAERVQALTGTAFAAPAQAELWLEGLVEPAAEGFRVRLVSMRPCASIRTGRSTWPCSQASATRRKSRSVA